MRPDRAKIRAGLLSVGLALSLAACSALPLPAPTETARPRPTRTHRPTKTPEPTETLTPFPSLTPQPLPSLTPTLPPALLSPTASPAVLPASPAPTPRPPTELNCKLLWQSPPNGAIYNPKDRFTVGWNIRNTGTAPWDVGSFMFVYVGGAHMSLTEVVHLPTTVAPGSTVVLSVPVRAPVNPTLYTMHWGLRQGNVSFCRVTLTIEVELP